MAMPAIRTEIKVLSIALLWACFCVGYFTRFPLPLFTEKLFLTAVAIVVLFSAFGFGAFCLRFLTPGALTDSEEVCFSTLLGLGIWSLILFAAGVFGVWSLRPVLGVLAFGAAAGWMHRAAIVRLWAPADEPVERPVVPRILVLITAILSLLIAFAPPTYYDTLVYHYTLPQSYLKAGRWIGQPTLIYSAFPQTMELLWLLGMVLAGDLLSNLLGWAVGALGVWAVYLFVQRSTNTRTAWWAAALLSVTPSYLLLSSGGYVDVGLTVFGFASFFALTLWAEKRSTSLLVLAGVLSGFALGCKYTGGISIVISACFIIKQTISKSTKNAFKSTILYGLSSFLIYVPWLVKNIHFVGNPVFPFLYKWGSKASPWAQQAAEGYFQGLTEYSPRSVLGLGKLLWEIAVGGLRFGGGMDVLGDLGWGALFVLLPALWLAKKMPVRIKNSLLYCVLFFVPWGLSRPVLRFLLPIAPFLAIVGAYAYTQVVQALSPWYRRAGQLVLAALICSNVALFFEVSDSLGLFQVPMGFATRTEFLSRRLKYYRASQFLETLPENAVTYVVGDQCAYYYNRPVLIAPVFNKNPLADWANEAKSGADLVTAIKSQGVTHLLINNTELERLNGPYRIFPLTEKGKANWDQLRARAGKRIYQDIHCEVLSLS